MSRGWNTVAALVIVAVFGINVAYLVDAVAPAAAALRPKLASIAACVAALSTFSAAALQRRSARFSRGRSRAGAGG